jgi:hypothetical protein
MAFCEASPLLRTSRVCPEALVQQTIGVVAAELLEEIQPRKQLWLMSRRELENKWIVSLFHVATARLTT